MASVSVEDEDTLAFLRVILGPDYNSLLRKIFTNYALVSANPARLRLKVRSEDDDSPIVKIDYTGPRYSYLKAAILTPPDTFDKIAFITLKYQAYIDMLTYYKCAALAFNHDIVSLTTYFPSEIERITVKYPSVFRVDKSVMPTPKSIRVYVLSEDFNIEVLDKIRPAVEDPYYFSVDANPHLSKPIAAEPPHVEQERAELQMAAAPVNWDKIQDIED